MCTCIIKHMHWTHILYMIPCVYMYEVTHVLTKQVPTVNALAVRGEICVYENLCMSHIHKSWGNSSKLKEKNSLLVTLFSWNVCCTGEPGKLYLHSITLPNITSVWTAWFWNTVSAVWGKHCSLKFKTLYLEIVGDHRSMCNEFCF